MNYIIYIFIAMIALYGAKEIGQRIYKGLSKDNPAWLKRRLRRHVNFNQAEFQFISSTDALGFNPLTGIVYLAAKTATYDYDKFGIATLTDQVFTISQYDLDQLKDICLEYDFSGAYVIVLSHVDGSETRKSMQSYYTRGKVSTVIEEIRRRISIKKYMSYTA